MRCPSCGTENADDARFCTNCGTTLGAADAAERDAGPDRAPEADAAAPAAPAPRRRSEALERLRRGWATAIRWAFVPLAASFALGLIVSALGSSAQPFGFAAPVPEGSPFDLSPLDVVTGGLIGAFGYHHASVTVSLPPFDIPDAPFPGGFRFSGSGSFAPMLGTMLVAFLLALAGRATARAAGAGGGWRGPLDGAKIALPYSLLALAVSFAARQSIEFPQIPDSPFAGGGALTLAISPLSAFLWAFLLAAVFGALGAVWAAPDEVFAGTWGVRLRAVLAGAWRMTWVALSLAFVGLLALAAVHSGGTRAYFELVGELGAQGGASFVLSTILALPNMATWVAAGSVGGSAMSVSFFGSSCGLVSYLRFPSGVLEGSQVPGGPEAFFADPCSVLPIRFETAPIGYFLYLLIPIAAVLAGGMVAGRRAKGAPGSERAAVGAAAGVVFALAFLGLEILSDMAFSLDFQIPFLNLGGGGFGIGPGLVSGTGLALLWGAAGGALGAVLAGRRTSAPAAEAERREPAAEGP